MPRRCCFGDLRARGLAVLLAVALAGCETTGSTSGGGSWFGGSSTAELTPEEQQLRAEARLFNETVLGGALTQAAIYGIATGLITLLTTGDAGKALAYGGIGAGVGAIAGAIDGYRVAVQQEAANRQVRELDVLTERVQAENQRMEETLRVMQEISRNTERRLAEVNARVAANQATAAELRAEEDRARRNLAELDKLITGAEKRQGEHRQIAEAVAAEGEDTARLDREIAETSRQLTQLRRERDILAGQIGETGRLA